MTAFKEYSKYYDLLYKDKGYAAEADYLDRLIQEYSPGAKSILNFGCGTGRHDFLLAEKGYEVCGVDLSEDMITIAKEKLKGRNVLNNLSFFQGDIRAIRLNRQHDIVTALFHVMSYQVTNDDIEKAFKTAHEHLKPGGIFIFDCWYGPGVLTDRPHVREKHLESESLKIYRKATPMMHPNENCVDVIYEMEITDKLRNELFHVKEVHKMRYLFLPEIFLITKYKNLDIIYFSEWLNDGALGFDSWNAVIIAKRKGL